MNPGPVKGWADRLLTTPLRSRRLRSPSPRVMSFTEARQAGQRAVRHDQDDPQVAPEAHTQLLLHPARTTRSVLMLHGYAGSPHSFAPLARSFHERGYNVYVPREPHHGRLDRPGRLSAEGLVRYADEALNIAAGLGDEVGVIGFSGGGTLATWLLAHRPGSVRRLLLLAPFFRPHASQAPPWSVRILTLVFGLGLLPDRAVPDTGYTLGGVAQYLRVMINQPTVRLRHGLSNVTLAYASLDRFIDREAALEVSGRIAEADGLTVQVHEFPPETGLTHDVVAAQALRHRTQETSELYLRLYES